MGKQKLSPEAFRRELRADSQRRRRAAEKAGKNLDGLDYDHNTGRFTSVAHNRGGTQSKEKPDGTKQEKKQSRRT